MSAVANPMRPAWFRRLIPIPAPPESAPAPAGDRAAASAKLAGLRAADAEIPEITRTRFVEPEGAALATIVVWHGFTNAPSQFGPAAEELGRLGFRVLVPRTPHHGLPDVLNRDLNNLTEAELVAHVDTCIDIAAGFGDPVWVIGLSAGGTLAGWAAANRAEVERLVLAAPLVAPKGFPLPLVRLMVRFPILVPRIYWWWDPRKKADLGHSPYAYPGFPIPGVMPFLHLSEAMMDHSVVAGHRLERVVLTSNPGDLAIRRDAARTFAGDVFGVRSGYYGEANIDPGLKWMHDFVDPYSPDAGTTEQVVAILTAALGVGEPAAGGVLVSPLLTEQPRAAG